MLVTVLSIVSLLVCCSLWLARCAQTTAPHAHTFRAPLFAEDPNAVIDLIVSKGMKPAMALKPKTPVESVFPYVERLHMVLIMTVEPGFGGQAFMPDMMPKVEALRAKFPALNIQVDGGLGPANIDVAAKAGANVIVAGTSVFKSADPAAAIATLRHAIDAKA